MSSELLANPAMDVTALAQAEQAKSIEQVRAAFLMAKKFPRDEDIASHKIRTACKRLSLAQVALYRYPRGGQNVTGPSIRLAETIVQYWGNIDCGVRELEQRPGESVVEAYCHDLETNMRSNRVWTVKHSIQTRGGEKRLTDPRDIYEKIANEGSRRLRACILAVIPGFIVEEAREECEKTLKSGGKDKPLSDRIRNMIHSFTSLGVTKEMIEARLKHAVESMTADELSDYIAIYTSLNDKMSKTSDWFDIEVSKQQNINEILGIT